MDADIAIVGLGTMGAMAAWRISERTNLRVIGFEQYGLGHSRGAAAGESRLFRTAYHEGSSYVPMLLKSRELWQELERISGREIFLPTGTLSIGESSSPAMSNVRESVLQHELPHEFLDADELRSRYPQHSVSELDTGILDRLGGALRPEVAVASALERARGNGVQMHEREPVTGIEDNDDGSVTVRTGSANYRVRHVIVATGPWAQEVMPSLASSLIVKPLVLTWFMPKRIDQFSADVFPTFIRDTSDFHIFGAPTLDGYSLKVSVNDKWGSVEAAGSVPRWLDDDQLRFVGTNVHRLLPGLSPEPTRHSVHMDAYTRDKNPIIGTVDGRRNLTVLAGFSGHGFKLSPIFGEIAAQLAVDGGSDFDLTMFAADRQINA